MIELVVTDLDGTLWDSQHVVAPETHAALGELKHRNIPVLAATARRTSMARRFFQKNSLDLPVLLLNGALGRSTITQPPFYSFPLPTEAVEKVLACLAEYRLMPFLSLETATMDLVTTELCSSNPEYLAITANQTTLVDDLTAVGQQYQAYNVSVVGYHTQETLAAAHADLVDISGISAWLYPDAFYDGWTLNINASQSTKWNGVRQFCELHNINEKNVLSVGDGANDLPLFASSRISCAMSHAPEKVKSAADSVLPSGDHAWAQILNYLE